MINHNGYPVSSQQHNNALSGLFKAKGPWRITPVNWEIGRRAMLKAMIKTIICQDNIYHL